MTVEPALDLCVLPTARPADQALHTRECSHLTADQLGDLVPASASQIAGLITCESCRAVLDGHRGQTFGSFEDAMEAFQAPLQNRKKMREIAARLDLTEIWIPSSAPYIAVAKQRGDHVSAYFNRGRVQVRNKKSGELDEIVLPTGRATSGSRSAAARREEMARGNCPRCWMELSPVGTCVSCDG